MENMYKMDHDQRGIALVINIKAYNPNPHQLDERKWSEKDIESLKRTLEYLEFDLKFYENLKANEIKEKIQNIAELDHTNSDCFLCVVMSHGSDDKIMASDSEEISLVELLKPIKSCESLQNKPKMFFFQACRGDKEMDRSAPDVSTSDERITSDNPNEETLNNITTTQEQSSKMEAESDLLVYYATLPKHYAYGTVADGTFFIKSVCKELNEAYKNLPNNMLLSGLILNINKSVRESGLELADPINRLVRDVKFTPKKVSF